MKAIELLEEATKEAGNVDISEFPRHGQKCQSLINQTIAELAKQPDLEAENKRLKEQTVSCPFCCKSFKANWAEKDQALAE